VEGSSDRRDRHSEGNIVGHKQSIVPTLQRLTPGTVIPKPEATDEFTVKGWGKRNGETA
jgi:hypothetical protein